MMDVRVVVVQMHQRFMLVQVSMWFAWRVKRAVFVRLGFGSLGALWLKCNPDNSARNQPRVVYASVLFSLFAPCAKGEVSRSVYLFSYRSMRLPRSRSELNTTINALPS